MSTDKIKRQFIWLRKVLELIDRTTLPGEILGEVRVGLELFGWDRLPETITVENKGATATGTVLSVPAPDGFTRVILQGEVVSSDSAIAQKLFLTQTGVLGVGAEVGVSAPTSQAIGEAGTPGVLTTRVFLQQGERLIGRAIPAPGVGENLTLQYRHIDLPFGEYIPYL